MKHAFAYVLNMNNRNPAGINRTLCLASQNRTLRELIFQFVLVEISFHEGYTMITARTLKQSGSFTVLSIQISLQTH